MGGVGEPLVRNRQSRGDDIRGIEARVYAQHLEKTADQQARAGEQHEGKGHFAHNQSAAKLLAGASRARAATAFLHRTRQVRPGRLNRRGQAEDQAGEDRKSQGEEQHSRVDRDIGFPRKGKRRRRDLEAGHGRISNGQTERPAANR